MKQEFDKAPHQEVEQVRTNHLRRAVANIDAALSIIVDTAAKGPIRDMHTIGHQFEHIIKEQIDHASQQTASVLAPHPALEVVEPSNVIDFVAERERMEAIARDSATLLAEENVDFMQLLSDAQMDRAQDAA